MFCPIYRAATTSGRSRAKEHGQESEDFHVDLRARTPDDDDSPAPFAILSVSMSVLIRRSSSLSSASGTKWYQVPIVIAGIFRRLISSRGKRAFHFPRDEFQVEFLRDTRARALIAREHAKSRFVSPRLEKERERDRSPKNRAARRYLTVIANEGR